MELGNQIKVEQGLHIKAPEGYVINLVIDHFELQACPDPKYRPYDYLVVRDGICKDPYSGDIEAPSTSKTPASGNPSKRHRERLNTELDCLASLLPFPSAVSSKLDKLSILRLAVAFLQAKTHFGMCLQRQLWQLYFSGGQPLDTAYLHDTIFRALGGFIIIVSENGEIFYATSNIEKYLGFHQSDILHQPLYDLVHSEDRNEVRQQLILSNLVTHQTLQCEMLGERHFTARFRCLLDNTCGFLRLEVHGFVSILNGLPNCYVSSRPDPTIPVLGLVALCLPLVPPLTFDSQEAPPVLLKSKHNLDLKMTSGDLKTRSLLAIEDNDLPISFYKFIHVDDLNYMVQTHTEVVKTGAAGLLVYRVHSLKSTKITWIQTSGRLFYKNGKPESISCTHRILTESEGFSLLTKRGSLASSLSFEDSLNPAKFPLAQSLFAPSTSQQKVRTKRYKSANSAQPAGALEYTTPIPPSYASFTLVSGPPRLKHGVPMNNTVVPLGSSIGQTNPHSLYGHVPVAYPCDFNSMPSNNMWQSSGFAPSFYTLPSGATAAVTALNPCDRSTSAEHCVYAEGEMGQAELPVEVTPQAMEITSWPAKNSEEVYARPSIAEATNTMLGQ